MFSNASSDCNHMMAWCLAHFLRAWVENQETQENEWLRSFRQDTEINSTNVLLPIGLLLIGLTKALRPSPWAVGGGCNALDLIAGCIWQERNTPSDNVWNTFCIYSTTASHDNLIICDLYSLDICKVRAYHYSCVGSAVCPQYTQP